MPLVGFIGTGSMGGALACAAAKGEENRLLLSNRHPDKAAALAEKIGGEVVDNEAVFRRAEILFIGVKPKMVAGVLQKGLALLKEREEPPLLISMAAGVELKTLHTLTENCCPVIRILPNIPVSVGAGVTFYAAGPEVSAAQVETFRALLRFSGELVPLEEALFDAGSAVAGCGGAFVAPFLEGLADGGLACGLPRKQAYRLAEQMVLGAAKWLLENDKLPAELKDATCSPGGTSIRGVRALEQAGLRSAAMEAVIAAYGGLDEL